MDGVIIYIKILSSVKKDLVTNLPFKFFGFVLFKFWSICCFYEITQSTFVRKHSFLRDSMISAYLFPVTPKHYSEFSLSYVTGIYGRPLILLGTNVAILYILQAVQGTGLAFIAFTEAMTHFPASPFWSVMFFLMLVNLGLGSMFGTIEGIITPVVDTFKVRKEILTGEFF